MICGVIGLLLGGCLVTDQITFEDAVNHPISILAYTPTDNLIPKTANESFTLTVVVTDPDVTDSADHEIEARLVLAADYWSNPDTSTKSCAAPQPLPNHGYAVDSVVFTIDCVVELGPLNVYDGSLVKVKTVVSDLGFLGSDADRFAPGAFIAEQPWVVQIAEEE